MDEADDIAIRISTVVQTYKAVEQYRGCTIRQHHGSAAGYDTTIDELPCAGWSGSIAHAKRIIDAWFDGAYDNPRFNWGRPSAEIRARDRVGQNG